MAFDVFRILHFNAFELIICFEIFFGYLDVEPKICLLMWNLNELWFYIRLNVDFMMFTLVLLGNEYVVWIMVSIMPIWNVMHDLWVWILLNKRILGSFL